MGSGGAITGGTHNICERKRAATWTPILLLRESPQVKTVSYRLTIKAPKLEGFGLTGGAEFSVMKQRQSKGVKEACSALPGTVIGWDVVLRRSERVCFHKQLVSDYYKKPGA